MGVRWQGVGLVVLVAAAALAVRFAVVAVTRRRRPAVAAAVDRWWGWAAAAVVAGILVWMAPIPGLVTAVVLGAVLVRSDAVGSPFRPRR